MAKKVKVKIKKNGNDKAKKAAKKQKDVLVDVRVAVPFERLEGDIKSANAHGITVKVKRPRSSKEDLVFVPAEDVIAYAKGAGKKGKDVVIVKSTAAVLLEGKAEGFKEGDKPRVIVDGVEWVLYPGNCQIMVRQPL